MSSTQLISNFLASNTAERIRSFWRSRYSVVGGMNALLLFSLLAVILDCFGRLDTKLSLYESLGALIYIAIWLHGALLKKSSGALWAQICVVWASLAVLSVLQSPAMGAQKMVWMVMLVAVALLYGLDMQAVYLVMATCVFILAKTGGWISGDGLSVGDIPTAALILTALASLAYMSFRWNNTKRHERLTRSQNKKKDQAAKNQFLVHINHELRNPLTSLLASVDLLSSEHESENTLKNKAYLMKTIKASSNHILSILNDVLEIERLTSGKITLVNERFSIRDTTREVIEICQVLADESNSKIEARVDKSLHDEWIGQQPRIRQVLINLIANSLKHAPGADVIISCYEKEQKLHLNVSDTGPGMSKQAMDNLFEPFSSSLGDTGTSGLGLRICKIIVEDLMAGTISVTSSKEGANFSIVLKLPKYDQAPSWEYVGQEIKNKVDSAPSSDFADSAILRKKSVLLVEDDENNSLVVAMVLESYGMLVHRAMSSQEAIGLYKQRGPFDIALIDHNLGERSTDDGIVLTKKLHDLSLGKIIGFTGNYSKEVEEKWYAAGVSDIVLKPAGSKTITNKISLLL